MKRSHFSTGWSLVLAQIFLGTIIPSSVRGQAEQSPRESQGSNATAAQLHPETIQDYNKKLGDMVRAGEPTARLADQDYRLGPDDLLDVSVFEAPDLNRTVRVSPEGEILLPLLGNVRAAGLTPSGLARVLEELLRASYMKDPHVGIFLREMQSHSVSVFGAVAKPGVYQIRGAKTLVEVLSMAQGLASDAGDRVIVEHQGVESAGPAARSEDVAQTAASAAAPDEILANKPAHGATKATVIEIHLKTLLDSDDPSQNVLVYPGDVVKVTRADVVYVVGEVRKPGGFQLNTNESISVLQALALAEGLTRTSAANRSRVIRTDRTTGARTEINIDIRRILSGKASDQLLQPRDIIFVPNSAGKTALFRGTEAALGVGTGLLIYRTP